MSPRFHTLKQVPRTRIINEIETILAFASLHLSEPLQLSMRTSLISTEESHDLGALNTQLEFGNVRSIPRGSHI